MPVNVALTRTLRVCDATVGSPSTESTRRDSATGSANSFNAVNALPIPPRLSGGCSTPLRSTRYNAAAWWTIGKVEDCNDEYEHRACQVNACVARGVIPVSASSVPSPSQSRYRVKSSVVSPLNDAALVSCTL